MKKLQFISCVIVSLSCSAYATGASTATQPQPQVQATKAPPVHPLFQSSSEQRPLFSHMKRKEEYTTTTNGVTPRLENIPGAYLESVNPAKVATPLPLVPSSMPATFEQHAQMRLKIEEEAKARKAAELKRLQEAEAKRLQQPQVVVVQQPVTAEQSLWALPGIVLKSIFGK